MTTAPCQLTGRAAEDVGKLLAANGLYQDIAAFIGGHTVSRTTHQAASKDWKAVHDTISAILVTVRPMMGPVSIDGIAASVIGVYKSEGTFGQMARINWSLDVSMHASRPDGWRKPVSGELEPIIALLHPKSANLVGKRQKPPDIRQEHADQLKLNPPEE